MSDVADWPAAWDALRALDDEAWDRESERLDAVWKCEHRAACVAFALSRAAWRREDAEVWAAEIADEALIELGGDPRAAAQKDVNACQRETANCE